MQNFALVVPRTLWSGVRAAPSTPTVPPGQLYDNTPDIVKKFNERFGGRFEGVAPHIAGMWPRWFLMRSPAGHELFIEPECMYWHLVFALHLSLDVIPTAKYKNKMPGSNNICSMEIQLAEDGSLILKQKGRTDKIYQIEWVSADIKTRWSIVRAHFLFLCREYPAESKAIQFGMLQMLLSVPDQLAQNAHLKAEIQAYCYSTYAWMVDRNGQVSWSPHAGWSSWMVVHNGPPSPHYSQPAPVDALTRRLQTPTPAKDASVHSTSVPAHVRPNERAMAFARKDRWEAQLMEHGFELNAKVMEARMEYESAINVQIYHRSMGREIIGIYMVLDPELETELETMVLEAKNKYESAFEQLSVHEAGLESKQPIVFQPPVETNVPALMVAEQISAEDAMEIIQNNHMERGLALEAMAMEGRREFESALEQSGWQ